LEKDEANKRTCEGQIAITATISMIEDCNLLKASTAGPGATAKIRD